MKIFHIFYKTRIFKVKILKALLFIIRYLGRNMILKVSVRTFSCKWLVDSSMHDFCFL